MKYVRLKDSEDEHDDEEEDIGSQDRNLIDGLLSFFTYVNSIYKKWNKIIKDWTKKQKTIPCNDNYKYYKFTFLV